MKFEERVRKKSVSSQLLGTTDVGGEDEGGSG